MEQQTAERAGFVHAGGHRVAAEQLYGADSWRSRHAHVFRTDDALRWLVGQHRDRLLKAEAIGKFRGRWFALEPVFSAQVLQLACEAGSRADGRRRAAQAEADRAAAERRNRLASRHVDDLTVVQLVAELE